MTDVTTDLAGFADTRPVLAAATAVERLLGGDVILSVGQPVLDVTPDEVLADAAVVLALPFTDGPPGCLALMLSAALVERLADTPAEALDGALRSAAAELGRRVDGATVAAVSGPELAGAPGSRLGGVVILEGGQRLAALAIRSGVDLPAAVGAPDEVLHEFRALDAAAPPAAGEAHPLALLHDVELAVTVELGRTRILLRDLLALTPGAVVELDRAAGSPVDMLVNGTLIARGEVVVIDEEFGIRVSEIVAGHPEPKRR